MTFTPIDDDSSSRFGDLVSVETFTSIANDLNYLMDSMPIGSVIPVLIGLPGVSEPDSTIWKRCDGSILVDQNSKLHDHALPNLAGLYMKGHTTLGEVGENGGSNTKAWDHNHGGLTQPFSIPSDNSDTDSDYITVNSDHSHPMPSGLNVPVNIEPIHIRVVHYIKVR
jgi:hypothetical protein